MALPIPRNSLHHPPGETRSADCPDHSFALPKEKGVNKGTSYLELRAYYQSQTTGAERGLRAQFVHILHFTDDEMEG